MAIARTVTNTSPVATSVTATPAAGGSAPAVKNYGAIKADEGIAKSGDLGKIGERLGKIYKHRSFGTPDQDEISRLAEQIASTRDGSLFGQVRQQVDSNLGSDAFTRASMEGVQVSPPSLSATDLADIMAGRRAATSGFEAVQDQARLAEGDTRRQFDMAAEERARMFEDTLGQLMGQLGDRGMGFQPAGAGQGRASLAEAESREAGRAEFDLQRQLAEIAEQVSTARRERDNQIAQLEAEEERRRAAQHREFLTGLQL